MVIETIPPTVCQETIRHEATEYRMRAIRCSQVVGVRSWQDERGQWHAACPRHIGTVMHRYPEQSPLIARAMEGDR